MMNDDFIVHVYDGNYLSFFFRLYELHNAVNKIRVKSFFG